MRGLSERTIVTLQKAMFAMFLFSLPYTSHAKDAKTTFQVITNNDNITCTVKPLTRYQTKQHIGSDTTFVLLEEELKNAHKNYMLVKILVENNTDQNLYLPKESYLSGLENYFVSKEEIISMYPNMTYRKIGSAIALLIFAACGGFCWYVKEAASITYASDRDLDIAMWSIISLFALGLVAGTFEYSEYCAVSKKIATLAKSAKCYKNETPKNKKHYRNNATRYKIPAHWTFEDIFFIDIQELDRTIFESYTPELKYNIAQ